MKLVTTKGQLMMDHMNGNGWMSGWMGGGGLFWVVALLVVVLLVVVISKLSRKK